MKKLSLAISSAFMLVACGENTTTEKIVEVASSGIDVVASVSDLPKCTKDNEGEQALVKGEASVRVCVDGKWFATLESIKDTVIVQGGKDTVVVAGDTVYVKDEGFSCTTKELADGSGLKIVCNGDSIGVVLNGKDGAQGEQGEPGVAGKDGTPGAAGKDGTDGKDGIDGVSCSIASKTDATVTIACGDSTITLELGEHVVNADTLALDSEKVATSLESLEGFTQKGPFLKGASVYLYELSDGRTLKQTNGNFTSYITDDDGRYRFTARDLVSQYAMVAVEGYYRNEVTGEPSSASIRLRTITDLTERTSANVNLLTNLEYDRVYYLVTREKKKVKYAKKQAQAEIFKAFHIDTTGFASTSEDLNVFGTTDADGALLAISILLQRDVSERELSVLLTEISSDMEQDGTWDDSTTRIEIAKWAFEAYQKNSFATYRKNVEAWNLGEVPPFEKYINAFWNREFFRNLGICGDSDNPIGTQKETRSNYFFLDYYNANFICGETGWYPGIEYAGRYYKTIWNPKAQRMMMAENLNLEYKIYDEELGDSVTYGNYCNTDECDVYGRYYTWAAAMDSAGVFSEGGKGCGYNVVCSPTYNARGICPEGWHIPTEREWQAIGTDSTFYKLLYSSDLFHAGLYSEGQHVQSGETRSYFWSSTQQSLYSMELEFAIYFSMGYSGSYIFCNYGSGQRKDSKLSIRCMEN